MSIPPLERPAASQPSIEEMLRDIRQGRIRLPLFQRLFEWTDEDIRTLFDSLYRGYPVGSLLFWETERRLRSRDLLELFPESSPPGPLRLIIDGQQRLTSLARVLLRPAGTADPEWRHSRWGIYFDLEVQQFHSGPAGEVPPHWLPMSEVADTLRFLEWLERLPQGPRRGALVQAANEVARALRDYRIPLYTVRSYDEVQAREIFERLNSCGKPLEPGRVFRALVQEDAEPTLGRIAALAQQVEDHSVPAEELLRQAARAARDVLSGTAAAWQRTYHVVVTALMQAGLWDDGNGALGEVRGLLHELQRRLKAAPMSAADLEEQEAYYRQAVIDRFERLTFRGVAPGQAISLPLEEVFVELQVAAAVPEATERYSAEERRRMQAASGAGPEEQYLELDSLRLARIRGWERGPTGIVQPNARHVLPRRPVHRALLNAGGLVVLGDPGAGKTTLLHYLALRAAQEGTLAGAGSSGSKGDWRQQETPLLPIFVPLAAYDDHRRSSGGDASLEDFLAIYQERWGSLPGLGSLFQAALDEGRALVLMDGVDEVLDRKTRRAVAEQIVRFIERYRGRGNHFVVTSRVVGYREAELRIGLPHVLMLDFSHAEIAAFARRFCVAFEIWAAGGRTAVALQRAAAEERALLDDVRGHPGVETLAANPLLLTMLALLRRQLGRLSERRIELYERYLRVLLEHREDTRSEGRQAPAERPDRRAATSLLIELALWLQEHRPSGTARRQDLHQALREAVSRYEGGNGPDAWIDRFLRDLCHAGLLVERGPDAFGFAHLTFQEYFAGRALARMEPEERWTILHPRLHDPRWREPILLCAGQLGVVEERCEAVQALVLRILMAGSEHEQQLHRDLFLAAEVMADDVGLPAAILDQLSARLQVLYENPVPSIQKKARWGLARLAAPLYHGPTLAFWDQWLRREPAVLGVLTEFPDLVRRSALRGLCEERLERGDVGTQITAIRALAPLAEDDVGVRQTLLLRLEDSNESVRNAALQALGPLCQENDAIRHAFIARLSDNKARGSALRALVLYAHTSPDVHQIILAMLQQGLTEWNVQVPSAHATQMYEGLRHLILDTLGQLPALDGVLLQAVLCRLDDPSNVIRASAIDALKESIFGEPEVRRAIEARLADVDWWVQVKAIEALAPWIRLVATVPDGLATLLQSPMPNVRAAAVRSISSLIAENDDLRLRAATLLEDKSSEVRQEAIRCLAPILTAAPELRQTMAARLDDQRSDILHRMVETVAPVAPVDADVRRRLLRILEGPDEPAAAAAARGLGPISGSDMEVRQALIRAMERPAVQSTVVHALGPQAACEAEVSTLLQASLWAPSTTPWARVEALWFLAPLVREDSIRATMLYWVQAPNNFLREVAARALAPLCPTDPAARAAIETCLQGEQDPVTGMPYDFMGSVRYAAIRALAPLVPQDPGLRARLVELLEQPIGASWLLQLAVGQALAPLLQSGGRTADELLIRFDAYPGTWAGVLDVLAMQMSVRGTKKIIEHKLDAPEAFVRAAAISSLASMLADDPALRTRVLDALNDPEAEVQEAAVMALAPLVDKNEETRLRIRARLVDSPANVRIAAADALAESLPDAEVRQTILDVLLSANAFHLWRMRDSLGRWLARDPALRHPLVPWLAIVNESHMGQSTADYLAGHWGVTEFLEYKVVDQVIRRSLAGAMGPLLVADASLLDEVTALLDAPAWQARQGAAWALAAMPGGPPPPLMDRIRGLLSDLRAEESWPERLQVCEVLLNDPDPALSRHAIAVARQALNHGKAPWYGSSAAAQVRGRAAEVLGGLDPLYRDDDLFALLLHILSEDTDPQARDAAYCALLRIAVAPES